MKDSNIDTTKQSSNIDINNNDQFLNNFTTKNFPIWEKLYLSIKSLESKSIIKTETLLEFIKYSVGVEVKTKKQFYFFPSQKLLIEEKLFPLLKKYYVFDLETEVLVENNLEYPCFNPVYDDNYTIYLFKINQLHNDNYLSLYKSSNPNMMNSISQYNDTTYQIIEFNLNNNEQRELQATGTYPKIRKYGFTAIYFNTKIYFFGGLPIYTSDLTSTYLYSFCTINYEWVIEDNSFSLLTNLKNNDEINNTYNKINDSINNVSSSNKKTSLFDNSQDKSNIVGKYDMKFSYFSKESVIIIGGKISKKLNSDVFKNINYKLTSKEYGNKEFLEKINKMLCLESYFNDIYELNLVNLKVNKINYSNKTGINTDEENLFTNFSLTRISESKILIYNNFNTNKSFTTKNNYLSNTNNTEDCGNYTFSLNSCFYLLDLSTNELSLIKNLMFHPEIEMNTNLNLLLSDNKTLYAFGKSIYDDSCFSFKTKNTYPNNSEFYVAESSNNNFKTMNITENIAITNNETEYLSLLNSKTCSNALVHFSNDNKQKDIYIDKRILSNLSHDVYVIMNSTPKIKSNMKSKKNFQDYFFSNTSIIGASNALILLYRSFYYKNMNLNYEVFEEVFSFFTQFQSDSIVNELVEKLELTNDNCLNYLDLSIKREIPILKIKCKSFIAKKLNESNNNSNKDISNTTNNTTTNTENQILNKFLSTDKKSKDISSIKKEMFTKYFCTHTNKVLAIKIKDLSILSNNTSKISNDDIGNKLENILGSFNRNKFSISGMFGDSISISHKHSNLSYLNLRNFSNTNLNTDYNIAKDPKNQEEKLENNNEVNNIIKNNDLYICLDCNQIIN